MSLNFVIFISCRVIPYTGKYFFDNNLGTFKKYFVRIEIQKTENLRDVLYDFNNTSPSTMCFKIEWLKPTYPPNIIYLFISSIHRL